MSTINRPTKEQLLKIIDELEKNPHDKVRILGDAGITLAGAGLGVAAAGTLASAAGVTSIWGLTTAASWVGVTAVSATPVGWIIGSAAVAGAVVYGVSRFIYDGGLAEERKLELLRKYKEEARKIEEKERAGSITDEDRTKFIVSIRELIEKNAIATERAQSLIEYVEQGRIPISQAYLLIQKILVENQPPVNLDKTAQLLTDISKPLTEKQVKEIEELEYAYQEGYLTDADFEIKISKIANT
ncbi:MAG: hypothetical protein Q8N96_09765 [Methylovulum sp.]|nr:hypothetical protein [Methylovulum sp.]